MPHSSGGGSHGGGFHGGGGFHSGGSHYNNHHTHLNSSIVRPRFSRHIFPGAGAYYYYRFRRPHIIYTSDIPARHSILAAWVTTIFLLLFLAIPAIFIPLEASKKESGPLKTNYDTTIIIDDAGDYLTDEQESSLEHSFTSFLNYTGITPALVTKTIDPSLISLKNYAYQEYLNRFEDEKHLLVVYEGGDEWLYETMQGNDTDRILTEKAAYTFNRKIYYGLDEGKDIAAAIDSSLDEVWPMLEVYPDNRVDNATVMFAIVWYVISIPLFVSSLIQLVNAYNMKDAQPLPEGSVLMNCPFCSSPYYTNTVSTCPHCGASLPKEEAPSNKEESFKKEEDEFAIDPDQYKIDIE